MISAENASYHVWAIIMYFYQVYAVLLSPFAICPFISAGGRRKFGKFQFYV